MMINKEMVSVVIIILLFCLLGCSVEKVPGSDQSTLAESASATTTPVPNTSSPTHTLTSTITPTNTPTSTVTSTATVTFTPSLTSTNTITLTPTFAFPEVEVSVNAAHCRYGPAKAYLHAADLYEGDRGLVQGRYQYSNWLYVKWEKLNYRCWVSPFVVNVVGDVSTVGFARIGLDRIPSTLYQPPTNVRATRNGDVVTITWDRVPMTEDDDRGYLIEAFVCQNGSYLWWPVSFANQYITSYTVEDHAGCPFESKGIIYTVEKHGYTEPVLIPWPSH